ncbi:TonB family protein [Pseudomonas fluorescens group sp.]|uniref:Protein TonB n=2 Tax=Pseudomonas fluorescens TaxID=294 RepID=C3JXS2_PSEFS|nr:MULTISPECIES: TonB family protein [Pseudomonas fluorescens group]MBZ6456507.1 TonB family protein [Pseudomonas fluorescens group sp.]MBZ6460693.1 TonB family protein [Pseudomonas fluorescens group sp.]MBZ6466335.1 TonB family protein [Pseudomonas fluorescens group sp.]WQD70042.1 TonB family protein [Pseudomonas marginalis]CAI2797896.1 Protein TonB [Pseudomonas fluorescens SBW25]
MTAMIMHSPTLTMAHGQPSGFWRNSFAASLAVALHVGVLAALMLGGSTEKTPVQAPRVMHTQLVMMPPAPVPVPVPAPAPEPVALTPPEPVAVPEPVKPTVDPQIQAQKLEKAALARKRVEDKKIEQQQERLATEQRNRELEQQRVNQERLAAERARPAAPAPAPAFDSRQYQPLSKEAPDYPERALDKNIEGDCSVEYTVNIQGRVENPRVLDGCHPLFMRPSLAAANTFRYQPRIVDGKPVPVPAVRNTFHYRIK